jgi:riboflavin kinase/FMN adenylyltransferase
MAIFYDLNKLPQFNKPVLTIGSFDGVHHGHKAILNKVASRAKAIGGESILITFDPHPRKIIQPGQHLGLLNAPEQKLALISRSGIDHIVVVPFSRAFSLMSAEEYIDDFLWKNFHPHTIVLGYDHHFGHSREGDIQLLKEKLGTKVQIAEIPPQLVDDAAVSSSKIRRALLEGNVELATEMLEQPFCLSGTVIHGEKLGRKLGFPTANLQLDFPDILIPKNGIYAVRVDCLGQRYNGMMSIGIRPTINDDQKRSIEVNILDFDQNIYGQTISVHFIKYLREERKCPSLEALQLLMKQDEVNARQILSN